MTRAGNGLLSSPRPGLTARRRRSMVEPSEPVRAMPPVPIPRSTPVPTESRRVLLVIVLMVLAIAGLGLVGTSAIMNYRSEQAIIARMGPMSTKSLPGVTVRMGNGRQIDVNARIQLREGLSPEDVAINGDRLRDQMVDRITNVPADALEGSDGARIVKDALGAAVKSQTDPDAVRGILLDQFLIH